MGMKKRESIHPQSLLLPPQPVYYTHTAQTHYRQPHQCHKAFLDVKLLLSVLILVTVALFCKLEFAFTEAYPPIYLINFVTTMSPMWLRMVRLLLFHNQLELFIEVTAPNSYQACYVEHCIWLYPDSWRIDYQAVITTAKWLHSSTQNYHVYCNSFTVLFFNKEYINHRNHRIFHIN